jgi:hypothetical protein
LDVHCNFAARQAKVAAKTTNNKLPRNPLAIQLRVIRTYHAMQ